MYQFWQKLDRVPSKLALSASPVGLDQAPRLVNLDKAPPLAARRAARFQLNGALMQAESIMEEYLAARGLPQCNSKHLSGVGVLIKIKVARAEVALELASSPEALHHCLKLCHEVDLLIPYAPYVGLHTRAKFHFFRARARRQMLVLRSSRT